MNQYLAFYFLSTISRADNPLNMFAIVLNKIHMTQTNSKNLLEIADKFPDLTVSISVKDLISANRTLIKEAKAEIAEEISQSRNEMFLQREKVMEILGVSSTTLWRWQRCGYLVPISIGGQHRYRLSDINRITCNNIEKQ